MAMALHFFLSTNHIDNSQLYIFDWLVIFSSPVIQADAWRDQKDSREYEIVQQRKGGLRLHLIVHFGRLLIKFDQTLDCNVQYDIDIWEICTVVKSIEFLTWALTMEY